jgi:site-specific DNA-cytosine methylase
MDVSVPDKRSRILEVVIAKAELLIDLEEEIGQRKETVGDLGRVLKETVPEELKDRVEQAIQDSVAMARKGRRYVNHVRPGWSSPARTRNRIVTKAPQEEGQRLDGGKRRQRSLERRTIRKTSWKRLTAWALEVSWTSCAGLGICKPMIAAGQRLTGG